MNARTVLRLTFSTGLLCLAGTSARAGDYGGIGGRNFGAAVSSGVYSRRSASLSVNSVGYPHGYGAYGPGLYYRPWYASPNRYQSYYYRPWYTYRNYYRPLYFGSYYPRAYGYLGRDPWPYDYGAPYGDLPYLGFDEPYGCSLPADDFAPREVVRGGYGGCYYW